MPRQLTPAAASALGVSAVPPTPADPISTILSYHNTFFGSEDLLPEEALLDEIDSYVPYFFPLYDSASSQPSGTLAAQTTDRGQIIASEECWILALIASASQGPNSFVFDLFDTEREMDFADEDIFQANGLGTAQQPFFLKSPQHIPVGGQIQTRIINLSASANAIQVVAYGVRPDMRKKVT